MSRIVKWVVVLALVGGAAYLGLVALTGSKAQEIASQQFAQYDQQNPAIELDLEWVDSGFWRSEGLLTMTADLDGVGMLGVTHTVLLDHGALAANVSGELEATLGGDSINERMLQGEPVVLSGRIGLGGARLHYAVPALEVVDDGADMVIRAAPFGINLALTDEEQHTDVALDWLRLSPVMQGDAKEGFYIEGVHLINQNRLDPRDSLPTLTRTEYGVRHATFNAGPQVQMSLNELSNVIEMERSEDNVDVTSVLSVEQVDYLGFVADLKLDVKLENLPFTALQNFQQAPQEDARQAQMRLLQAAQQNEARLHVQTLESTIKNMGRVAADGEFWLRDSLPSNANAESIDYLNGRMTIADLPAMLRMPLAGVIDGELPWTFELEDGQLTVNGDVLEVPAQ